MRAMARVLILVLAEIDAPAGALHARSERAVRHVASGRKDLTLKDRDVSLEVYFDC